MVTSELRTQLKAMRFGRPRLSDKDECRREDVECLLSDIGNSLLSLNSRVEELEDRLIIEPCLSARRPDSAKRRPTAGVPRPRGKARRRSA